MDPGERPTFAVTFKHLEFLLEDYKPRPKLEDAMSEPAKEPLFPLSAEQQAPSLTSENKQEHIHVTFDSPPLPNPPAVMVSAETPPALGVRSTEKRRQSWIAERYKLFNMATEDLLKNTPGKLKSFFQRAIRTHAHFDPSKQKKVRDNCHQKSSSQLKSFSLNGEDVEHRSFCLADSVPSKTHPRRFLGKKTSEQDLMYNFSLKEDCVDGQCKLRSVKSDSSFTKPSNLHEHPSSSKLFADSEFCPLPDNCRRFAYPVCKDFDHSSTPRNPSSTPIENTLNFKGTRRTLHHREASEENEGSEEKHKSHKCAFWVFKRKGSKEKNSF